jgi:hypothetical protein
MLVNYIHDNVKVYGLSGNFLIQVNLNHRRVLKLVMIIELYEDRILIYVFLSGARRLVLNVEHFQTNYIIVIIILSIYCV